MINDRLRFLQLLQLVDKETLHLEQIIHRFFEQQETNF